MGCRKLDREKKKRTCRRRRNALRLRLGTRWGTETNQKGRPKQKRSQIRRKVLTPQAVKRPMSGGKVEASALRGGLKGRDAG